ncbi:hypothetical protein GPALN_013128 [Globodera pallida]|nr:hypothetical protein GPALN_013128 [Globodera pallida]
MYFFGEILLGALFIISGVLQEACDSFAGAVSRRGSDGVRTLSPHLLRLPHALCGRRALAVHALLCVRG